MCHSESCLKMQSYLSKVNRLNSRLPVNKWIIVLLTIEKNMWNNNQNHAQKQLQHPAKANANPCPAKYGAQKATPG